VKLSIDVIIPTFNRPLRAGKLALSLVPQLSATDRILVVWQGEARPDIAETGNICLLHVHPPSLPKARNTGIRAGKSGIVLFLDDDVTVAPGLLDAHRKAYDGPSIGAVVGRIDDPLFDRKEERAAVFDETTGRLTQNFCVDKSQVTVSIMGANMSFRRQALAAVGLFDESFTHNALWEEVDAAFRLRKAGWALWYCHCAMVQHRRDPDGGCRTDAALTYCFHQFANTAYFAARHCEGRYRKSWYTYWKYRLEYESRKKILWFRHDPLMVAAGMAGAVVGLLRHPHVHPPSVIPTDTTISIIIPTYKRHALLEKALEAIRGNYPAGAEIIVVDQSPDNRMQSGRFLGMFPFIKYICIPEPSLPGARNAGIMNSAGKILLFFDDDAVIEPRCIYEHLALHERSGINVVAGRVRQMNDASWSPIGVVATVNNATGETAGNFDLDYEGYVLYATGGHLSVKRSVFYTTGLFNTRFIGNALFEDIDFSFRVRSRGFGIWYSPRPIIYHYPCDEGGCHSHGHHQYLMDRLHNHALFYALHCSLIPSGNFLKYMRNLMEFISRIEKGRHSVKMMLECLSYLYGAYRDACISFLFASKPAGRRK
jgi:GT2 family glycosyltransferase